jgi:outer membrane protein TolC
VAQPRDEEIRGKWWEAFGDSQLSALVEQVQVSNQNVLFAGAQFRRARPGRRLAFGLFPDRGRQRFGDAQPFALGAIGERPQEA